MSETATNLQKYISMMLKIQAELNAKTNGEMYLSKEHRTSNGRLIYYPICLKMEAAELLDSIQWKHWKTDDKPYDFNNLKIEIIDLLHFALSLHIEHYYRSQRDLIELESVSVKETTEKLLKHISKDEEYADIMFNYISTNVESEMENICKNLLNRNMEPYIGFMHYIDSLMSFQFAPNVVCIRKLYETIFILYALVKIIEQPLIQTISIDVLIKEIFDLYKAKVALNKLRQDKGYNKGTYNKQWLLDGKEVEDNEWMINFITKNKVVTDSDFYNILRKEYERQFSL